MGVKGPDGVAGLPGEKVCLCSSMCDLTHGKCSLCQWLLCNCEHKWEDRTFLFKH